MATSGDVTDLELLWLHWRCGQVGDVLATLELLWLHWECYQVGKVVATSRDMAKLGMLRLLCKYGSVGDVTTLEMWLHWRFCYIGDVATLEMWLH